MKINIFLFLWITVVGSLTAQSSDFFTPTPRLNLDTVLFQANYTMKFMLDSTNVEDVREEKMILLVGESMSLFQSYNRYRLDAEVRKVSNMDDLHALTRSPIRSRFNYHIFKNYPDGYITTTDYVLPDDFRYQEKVDLFQWDLTGQFLYHSGYRVQKATTKYGGRNWEAWFTNEIPINDGPYKFHGLPGLIVKVSDTKGHWVFELISLEPPDEIHNIELKESRYLDVSRTEFINARDAFRNDIINRAQQAGLDTHSQQVAAENMKRMNNPIELIAD